MYSDWNKDIYCLHEPGRRKDCVSRRQIAPGSAVEDGRCALDEVSSLSDYDPTMLTSKVFIVTIYPFSGGADKQKLVEGLKAAWSRH